MMNKSTVIGAIIMVAVSEGLAAQKIEVRLSNIDTNRPGNILVFLFGSEGFPKDHSRALAMQSRAADAGEMEFSFEMSSEIQIDDYAIKALHDEDNSGKVTKNWTGFVPAEGLGFTNGARLSLTGPPSYKRAKLELLEGTQVKIEIRYPRSSK